MLSLVFALACQSPAPPPPPPAVKLSAPERVDAHKLVKVAYTIPDGYLAVLDVLPEEPADILEVPGGIVFAAPPGRYRLRLRALKAGQPTLATRADVVVGQAVPVPPVPVPPGPPAPLPPDGPLGIQRAVTLAGRLSPARARSNLPALAVEFDNVAAAIAANVLSLRRPGPGQQSPAAVEIDAAIGRALGDTRPVAAQLLSDVQAAIQAAVAAGKVKGDNAESMAAAYREVAAGLREVR